MSLAKWHILSLASEQFLQDIKWMIVFGPSGNEAIIANHREELYALGTNGNCCLGLGRSITPGFHPKLIDSLKGISISSISYGSGPHVLALSNDGTVYSWGSNGYGQLGSGSTAVHNSTPILISHSLKDVTITKIACGGFHSLALSNTGMVFSWGFNNCGQLGTGDTTSQYSPTRINGLLEGKTCISITCNHSSSFALSSEGEVFSWGQNGSGQLGLGSTLQHHQPSLISLPNIYIDQIVGGYSHILALSDGGIIYSWGGNTHGQLGNGSKQCVLSPTPINNIGRVSEVAAVHLSHLSAASSNGKVYIWGECYHQNICEPIETQFGITDEAFACFSSPGCSWRPFKNLSTVTDVSTCIEKRFDDPETSDIVFVVEGQRIHVHRAILRMRSNYFYSMLQNGKWKESKMDTFEINEYSYQLFKVFLNYFYTNRIDLPDDNVPDLLELADCYCETDLKRKCEQILTRQISVSSVLTLYTTGLHFQAKDLEEACFHYIIRHCSSVILSKGFASMEDSLAKKLLVKLAEAGIFKS